MKEKVLRAARKSLSHPKREAHRVSQQKPYKPEQWGQIFNILTEKNFKPRISYSAKLTFINEQKIKSFIDKQMLGHFITTRPTLQELLKEALNMERKNWYQALQKHTKLKRPSTL